MRIGILSDSHFMMDEGNSDPHWEYGTTRLAELVAAHMSALKIFEEYKVEAIVHGGDLGDNKNSIPIPVWKAIGEVLRQSKLPWAIVPGNHFTYTRTGSIHGLSAIALYMEKSGAQLNVLHGGPGPVQMCNSKLLVWGIGYHADNNMKEFYARCKRIKTAYETEKWMPASKATKIVVLHQGLKEATIKKAPLEVEKELSVKKLDKYFDWADLIVIGHYHDPQRITKRILVPGAICQHSFRDAGSERYVWIYDTEKQGLIKKSVGAPKFHVGAVDAFPEADKGDRVRIAISNIRKADAVVAHYKESGAKASFSLIPEKSEDNIRDSSVTLSTDDVENLHKYIESEASDELNKNMLKKYGKEIIDQVRSAV